MPRYYFDIEQQSDEWHAAKLGMFSGSDFHIMLGNSASKQSFLYEKYAEREFGDVDIEQFTTPAMERGVVLEHEARRVYCAVYETEVTQVGLVADDGEFDGYAVCSPDGLVGDDGIIEVKCPLAKNMLEWIENNFYISPKYRTQVQFNLFITGRAWCDFIYYHPRAGLHVKRIERDEAYIEKIREALREGVRFLKDKGV